MVALSALIRVLVAILLWVAAGVSWGAALAVLFNAVLQIARSVWSTTLSPWALVGSVVLALLLMTAGWLLGEAGNTMACRARSMVED